MPICKATLYLNYAYLLSYPFYTSEKNYDSSEMKIIIHSMNNLLHSIFRVVTTDIMEIVCAWCSENSDNEKCRVQKSQD